MTQVSAKIGQTGIQRPLYSQMVKHDWSSPAWVGIQKGRGGGHKWSGVDTPLSSSRACPTGAGGGGGIGQGDAPGAKAPKLGVPEILPAPAAT